MAKINTTNRIRIRNATIYVSSTIVGELKDHLVRLNQVMACKRDEYDEFIEKLKGLAETKPQHFLPSSRDILQSSGK